MSTRRSYWIVNRRYRASHAFVSSITQRRRPRRWRDSIPLPLLEDAHYVMADPEGNEFCLLTPKWK